MFHRLVRVYLLAADQARQTLNVKYKTKQKERKKQKTLKSPPIHVIF